MKRETLVTGGSACDRGSGRAPGKRIRVTAAKTSNGELFLATKQSLDNRIQGLVGAKQTTK